MKNTFSKVIGFFILTFLGGQTAFAQYQSDRVDSLIAEYDYLRDSDNIGVSMPLNLSQTLPNYYRNTYLYLHDELQDQLDQLIEISPLPKSPLGESESGGRQVLEEHIAAEGRIAAKMKELDLVSKAVKVSGSSLSSPFHLLSDWQLRSYHYQLMRAFALNEGFSEEGMGIFKVVYDNALGAAERELRERGMFPKSVKAVPDWQQLMQERFKYVEELNRSARQEALYLVDKSALVLEEQVRIAAITEKVGEIDGKLGIELGNRPQARDLWTEETVVFRMEVLAHGKKMVHEKQCATRNYSDENLLHLAVIDEQLAKEKQWLYFEKNHQVIKRGYDSRGPPGDLPPGNFEELPYPKAPSPDGDRTLDRFLDEAKAASIAKNKEAAFEKAITHQLERFKAYNLDRPRWHDNVLTTKFARNTPNNTPESYLRFLSTRHLETLSSGDFGKAGQYKAAFDVTMQRLYPDENRPPVSFLEDDPAKLRELEARLNPAYESAQKRIEIHKPYDTPAMHYEAETLNTALNQVKAAQEGLPLKPRIIKGQKVNRPPPSWTDLPESINNEAHFKAVLVAQKQSLERIKANYGIDVPVSVEFQLNTINRTLIANEMAASLGEYQKYAKDASDLKILIWYKELFPDLFPEAKELEARQAALVANFDETFERLKIYGEESVFPKLFEAARNAHRSLEGGEKRAKGDGVWRPNQDLDKVKSMNLAKDPGGIWLSPEGFEIQPVVPLDLKWESISFDEGCPNEDDFEWIIDPEADYIEKICFPRIQKPFNTQHWLNQTKSW